MNYEIIDGIKVEIFERKVQRVRIKIEKTGRVSIITPLRFPKSKAIAFFKEKIELVKKHLKNSSTANKVFTFKSGEQFYLFGEETILKIEKSVKNSYLFCQGELVLNLKNIEQKSIKNYFYKVLGELLLKNAEPMFDKWANITGLKPSGVRVHKTVSRWGSCNVKTAVVNLSVYLANLPEYCLDYVVLHELCHLKYANHGEGFKNMLSSFMPRWKTIKTYMREDGNKLRLVD